MKVVCGVNAGHIFSGDESDIINSFAAKGFQAYDNPSGYYMTKTIVGHYYRLSARDIAGYIIPLSRDRDGNNKAEQNTISLLKTIANLLHKRVSDLTIEEFEDYVKMSVTKYIEDNKKDVSISILWAVFKADVIKNMDFTIDYGMWTYGEYQSIGITTVKGMYECTVCGTMCNTIYTGISSMTNKPAICSVNCLNKYKYSSSAVNKF